MTAADGSKQVRDDGGAVEVAGGEEQPVKPVSRFTKWYRSPLFNVIIVGLISFTQPGIWTALNNTGAGGQQEPYLVNGSNSLTFGYGGSSPSRFPLPYFSHILTSRRFLHAETKLTD